ncbi:MAG: tetratricopeptide repeat protein [Bacteroidota bacterium]
MYRLFLLCSILLTSSLLLSQSAELTAARNALTAGEGQVVAFDSLLNSGQPSAELYQALGNAHFEEGNFAKAILNYERGLRLQPGNKALKNNLKYVRAEAGINRLELKGFFLVRWWRAVGASLGAGACFWLAMVSWWLAVIGAMIWFLRRKRMEEKQRFALLPLAGILLGLAVLFFSLGNSRNNLLSNDREAILLSDNTDLRVAPGPDATLEESLNQGLKLRILDEFDGYVKVALDDGKQGWVPIGAVERI